MDKVSVKLVSPAKIDGKRRSVGETIDVDPTDLAGLAADGVIDPSAASGEVISSTLKGVSLSELSEMVDAAEAREAQAMEALDLCQTKNLQLLKQVAEAEAQAKAAEEAAKALEAELAELKAQNTEAAKATPKKVVAAKA